MPNNFQPHVPDFQRGERLSAARLNELADAIAKLLWHKQQSANAAFGVRTPLEIIGKLDDDLPAATEFATSPGEAVMTVWIKDAATGNLIETDRKENIKQRFESADEKAAGDEVRAAWIEGEWVALPGGGGGLTWGKVISGSCGWYTIELGRLAGSSDAGSYSGSDDPCNPCDMVTSAGTVDCGIELTYPQPKVEGSGVFVTAYDPESIIVPLEPGTDCIVSKIRSVTGAGSGSGSGAEPLASGSGSGTEPEIWGIVRGLQKHLVQYRERGECCPTTGQWVTTHKTPIIFPGIECAEIQCAECPPGSGSA